MEDLLSPSLEQVKDRNRLWADALTKNKRKARFCMKDCKGGRCCLQVASDVAKKSGIVFRELNDNFPDVSVAKFYGWNSVNPLLALSKHKKVEASSLNDIMDGKGLSHKEIAKCVLNTFVDPIQ